MFRGSLLPNSYQWTSPTAGHPSKQAAEVRNEIVGKQKLLFLKARHGDRKTKYKASYIANVFSKRMLLITRMARITVENPLRHEKFHKTGMETN